VAIPARCIKLTFKGNLQGGEVFAHSLYFQQGTQPTQAELNAWVTNAATTFNSLIGTSTIKSFYPTTTSYLTVTAYSYAGGPAADLVAGPANLATFVGTGSNSLPNQCASVISVLTGIPGRSFRGRFYLPGPQTGALATTGQIGSASITPLLNGWASFCLGMETGGLGQPAGVFGVVSATRTQFTAATQLRMDSRVDVQRRRGNKQVVTNSQLASV